MALATHDINEIDKRMRASIDALKKEFSGLRTGRASANLLDPVHVNVYGSRMPLNQVATVSVPEPRTISVQVWDKQGAGGGKGDPRGQPRAQPGHRRADHAPADPVAHRRPAPGTGQARPQVCRAGEGRRPQRAARGMDLLKKLEKDGKMSQDDHHGNSAKVQELTDRLIKEIDETLATKEAEIQKV